MVAKETPPFAHALAKPMDSIDKTHGRAQTNIDRKEGLLKVYSVKCSCDFWRST